MNVLEQKTEAIASATLDIFDKAKDALERKKQSTTMLYGVIIPGETIHEWCRKSEEDKGE